MTLYIRIALKRNSTGGKDGWDPEKYLNIWVCNLNTSPGGGMTLGYSYLPGCRPNQMWRDGLVVDFQYFCFIMGYSTVVMMDPQRCMK